MSLAAGFCLIDAASAHDLMRLGPQSLEIRASMFLKIL